MLSGLFIVYNPTYIIKCYVTQYTHTHIHSIFPIEFVWKFEDKRANAPLDGHPSRHLWWWSSSLMGICNSRAANALPSEPNNALFLPTIKIGRQGKVSTQAHSIQTETRSILFIGGTINRIEQSYTITVMVTKAFLLFLYLNLSVKSVVDVGHYSRKIIKTSSRLLA